MTLADYEKVVTTFCTSFAADVKIESEDFKVESIGGYPTYTHARYVSEPVRYTAKIEMPLDRFCELSNNAAKEHAEAIVREKVASVKAAYEHYQLLMLLSQREEKRAGL